MSGGNLKGSLVRKVLLGGGEKRGRCEVPAPLKLHHNSLGEEEGLQGGKGFLYENPEKETCWGGRGKEKRERDVGETTVARYSLHLSSLASVPGGC